MAQLSSASPTLTSTARRPTRGSLPSRVSARTRRDVFSLPPPVEKTVPLGPLEQAQRDLESILERGMDLDSNTTQSLYWRKTAQDTWARCRDATAEAYVHAQNGLATPSQYTHALRVLTRNRASQLRNLLGWGTPIRSRVPDAIVEQATRTFQEADAELNVVYRQCVDPQVASARTIAALERAHSDWIVLRAQDASWQMQAMDRHAAREQYYIWAKTAATRARTQELKQLFALAT